MSRTDDRRDVPLPVTGEVGSEGGSYADPANQVDTFQSPLKDRRADGEGGASSTATYAIDAASVAGGGVGAAPGPTGGMMRFPTEPPPPRPAPGASFRLAPGWRSALLGAAAGLAIGLLGRRR